METCSPKSGRLLYPLPGSFSAAFAQFEDCGHVLATLPGASSPQSRAEEQIEDDNEKRKQWGLVSVHNFTDIRYTQCTKKKNIKAIFLILYFNPYKMSPTSLRVKILL